MPVVAAIGAGAAVAGNIAGAAAGVGKSDYTSQNYTDPGKSKYDANAFNYGGSAGAGQDLINYREGLAHDVANHGAYQTDYRAAAGAREMGLSARNSQVDAVDMARSAANGGAPSVAGLQMRQGADDAIRSQQALAASARGPAGMAAAQGQMAGNVASMQQQNNMNAGMLRAQEMSDARGMYGSMASQLRASDMGMQSQEAQQAQFQGNLEMQQRGLNQQGMFQAQASADDIRAKQAQMAMARQQFEYDAFAHSDSINSGVAAQNAGADQRNLENVMSSVSSATSAGGMAMNGGGKK